MVSVMASEGLSSSHDTCLPVPRPYTPESSSTPAPESLVSSMAFAHSRQARHSLFPSSTDVLTTPQASLHVADRTVVSFRFDARISPDAGKFPTEGSGTSPGRTFTGKLS